MDWNLKLTADSVDDSETLLRTLSATIAASGGWILIRSTNAEGTVHFSFEFERDTCIEIYTALMAAGLELSYQSHAQFTQLCHCTWSRNCGGESVPIFDPARVDISIVSEQFGSFEPKTERAAANPAHRSRP